MTYGLLFGGGPTRLFRSVILFLFARPSYSPYLVHLAMVPFALSLAGAAFGRRTSVSAAALVAIVPAEMTWIR